MKVIGMIHIPGVNDDAYAKYSGKLQQPTPKASKNNYFGDTEDYDLIDDQPISNPDISDYSSLSEYLYDKGY